MSIKTLLGTLVKTQPYYMELLMKPHHYQEIFNMDTNWVGLLEFTKKSGTSKTLYHNYISSVITIQDEHVAYQEHIEYFLVPSDDKPVIMHPTWRKNKVKIHSKEVPSSIFKMLSKKQPCDTLYSSHPR